MAIKDKPVYSNSPYRLISALGLLLGASIGLLLIRILVSDSVRYGFLPWNLTLAVVPALLSWWLVTRVRAYGWLRWQQIILTVLWLAFLPNSFYIITDLIHLRVNYEADLLFDITLLMSAILAGLIFGYLSVYTVHRELRNRLSERVSYVIIGTILLAASFAICLGRYTRWNSWDILLQPAGLLFDVSDRLINPDAHLVTYQTTLILWILLVTVYAVIYEAARFLRGSK